MEQKDSAEWILKQIPYEIVYSARKTLAVQVKADGSVVVRAPKRMAKYKIEAFLKEKQQNSKNGKRCAGKWMDLSTAVWRFHFGRLSFCARAGAD